MKTSECPSGIIETQTTESLDHKKEETSDILELVTRRTESLGIIQGLVIGRIEGFNGEGVPCVNFSLNSSGRPLACRATVALDENHAGRDVALMFENNDARKPIIIGLMHEAGIRVEKDGAVLDFSSDKEILIRCGESSIHMKSDGQIIIKGREILTRATCNHRIQGGAVHIN